MMWLLLWAWCLTAPVYSIPFPDQGTCLAAGQAIGQTLTALGEGTWADQMTCEPTRTRQRSQDFCGP